MLVFVILEGTIRTSLNGDIKIFDWEWNISFKIGGNRLYAIMIPKFMQNIKNSLWGIQIKTTEWQKEKHGGVLRTIQAPISQIFALWVSGTQSKRTGTFLSLDPEKIIAPSFYLQFWCSFFAKRPWHNAVLENHYLKYSRGT